MRQDAVFWQRNTRAYALFEDLRTRADRYAYDDDFLAQLSAYRIVAPDSERADIFAARYLLAHNDPAGAIACGERAFRRRPTNHETWRVLSLSYESVGRYADALVMQGYAENIFGVPISLALPPERLTRDLLDRLSVAMGVPNYAPFAVCRMTYDAKRGLSGGHDIFAEEFLPVSPHIRPQYYVGAYAEQESIGSKAWLLRAIRKDPGVVMHCGGDFIFDIIRGTRVSGSVQVELSEGEGMVLPVIGTEENQKLRAETPTLDDTTWLDPAAPNFFRIEERTRLSSAHDFIVGTPIRIGHAPDRYRLVLNILVDALSWTVLRDRFATEMPNAYDFFSRGTIFDRHFSAAEYTYPSLPTIETGMYLHHSKIFNDRLPIELNKDYITLSERMKERGYATVNLMGGGHGIYNGVTRGYDRLVIAPYHYDTYEGIERLIRYIDGLPNVDHFIYLHTMDVHPWASASFQAPSSVQLRLPLSERLSAPDQRAASPYLQPNAFNQEAFWQGVRNTDRALGTLFAYLARHYTPDEYVVSLYSDHGVPIFSECHDIADPEMTGAAWMMRGAGVPEGLVTDELTSTVDIYPALAYLADFPVGENVDGMLPKAFGGSGRDIVYSNSLFPTKAYYLAARSHTHALRLTVADAIEPDGTVDISKAEVKIYPRDHEGDDAYIVDNEELRAFFYPRVRSFLRGIDNNGEVFPWPRSPA